jgi:hypothetical protein
MHLLQVFFESVVGKVSSSLISANGPSWKNRRRHGLAKTLEFSMSVQSSASVAEALCNGWDQENVW